MNIQENTPQWRKVTVEYWIASTYMLTSIQLYILCFIFCGNFSPSADVSSHTPQHNLPILTKIWNIHTTFILVFLSKQHNGLFCLHTTGQVSHTFYSLAMKNTDVDIQRVFHTDWSRVEWVTNQLGDRHLGNKAPRRQANGWQTRTTWWHKVWQVGDTVNEINVDILVTRQAFFSYNHGFCLKCQTCWHAKWARFLRLQDPKCS